MRLTNAAAVAFAQQGHEADVNAIVQGIFGKCSDLSSHSLSAGQILQCLNDNKLDFLSEAHSQDIADRVEDSLAGMLSEPRLRPEFDTQANNHINYDNLMSVVQKALEGDEPGPVGEKNCDDYKSPQKEECKAIVTRLRELASSSSIGRVDKRRYIKAIAEQFELNHATWPNIYEIEKQDFLSFFRFALVNPELINRLQHHDITPMQIYNNIYAIFTDAARGGFNPENTFISEFMPAVFMKQCREAHWDNYMFEFDQQMKEASDATSGHAPPLMRERGDEPVMHHQIDQCLKAFGVDEKFYMTPGTNMFKPSFQMAIDESTQAFNESRTNKDAKAREMIQDKVFQMTYDSENLLDPACVGNVDYNQCLF